MASGWESGLPGLSHQEIPNVANKYDKFLPNYIFTAHQGDNGGTQRTLWESLLYFEAIRSESINIKIRMILNITSEVLREINKKLKHKNSYYEDFWYQITMQDMLVYKIKILSKIYGSFSMKNSDFSYYSTRVSLKCYFSMFA